MRFLEKSKISIDHEEGGKNTPTIYCLWGPEGGPWIVLSCVALNRQVKMERPLFWLQWTESKQGSTKNRGRISAGVSRRKTRKGEEERLNEQNELCSARARVYIQSYPSQLPYWDRGSPTGHPMSYAPHEEISPRLSSLRTSILITRPRGVSREKR